MKYKNIESKHKNTLMLALKYYINSLIITLLKNRLSEILPNKRKINYQSYFSYEVVMAHICRISWITLHFRYSRFTAVRTNLAKMENQCSRSREVESILGHSKTGSRILFALLLQLHTHQGPRPDRTVARLTQIAQMA